MTKAKAFISIICPVRNGDAFLRDRLGALSALMADVFEFYEIIVVDNASTDGTITIVKDLLARHKNIQYCALSSRVSDSVAYSAGLMRSIGDFTITMDLRFDPPTEIPQMYQRAAAGTEIVYGLPKERIAGNTLYDRLARLFLKLVGRLNSVNMPAAMSSFRIFSRSVLNYILESANFHRTLLLAPALSGYEFKTFEYERLLNMTGETQRVGPASIFRALDLVFSTSVRPLRLASVFAVVMSVLSVLYATYVVITRLVVDNVAPGWATLSLQISILFFFVSIVLAIMCEYVLQILETSNARPPFHVVRELYSSTMDYEQGLNVRVTNDMKENVPRSASINAPSSLDNQPAGSK